MLIDTHAHLDYKEYDADRAEVVARAVASGVREIISISTRTDSSANAVALANQFPEVWATVGIHPTEADTAQPDFIGTLGELAKNSRVVALGEMGLDYYRLPERDPQINRDEQVAQYKSIQTDVFRKQLDLAAELELNVVIHQRDSWDDLLSILKEYTGRVRGVYHCFGGTVEQAQELYALGHLVSFTGLVTFKNAQVLQNTAKCLPLGQFMVETDCPYLAPVPHRGKRCEPGYTRIVADWIAHLRGIPLEAVAEATTHAARQFFNFTRR